MGVILKIVLAFLLASPVAAQTRFITVASTTSTEQSGLFRHLLPIFEKKTGIQVRVVALGTGQALDMGRRGDADVAFVHDKAAEERLVAEGYFVERREVMYNDFVIVGPRADPAGARGPDAVAAVKKIAAARAPFASRGDNSGTHAAERRLWKLAGIEPKGTWYRATGSGMGATLNTASGMNAYALTDRGTWLSFRNRGELAILVEGDRRLFNQYGVILVNPKRHPHVKADMGRAFIAWLVSAEGQNAIAAYKVNGEQLFFPNAINGVRSTLIRGKRGLSLIGTVWNSRVYCNVGARVSDYEVPMSNYYESEDLKRFPDIGHHAKKLADDFFRYYGEVTGTDGALTKREKALIALAVSHAQKCPYCIDAYTTQCLETGANPEQMMEAVHVAAVMQAGITLVHSVQMQNHLRKLVL